MSLRLFGNTVLLEPLPDVDAQVSASGIVSVNHYHKPTLKFRVLAVGPGEFRKRTKPSGKVKTVAAFDKPECSVGDCVLCRAGLDNDATVHSLDDGTGRVIVRGEALLMAWME